MNPGWSSCLGVCASAGWATCPAQGIWALTISTLSLLFWAPSHLSCRAPQEMVKIDYTSSNFWKIHGCLKCDCFHSADFFIRDKTKQNETNKRKPTKKSQKTKTNQTKKPQPNNNRKQQNPDPSPPPRNPKQKKTKKPRNKAKNKFAAPQIKTDSLTVSKISFLALPLKASLKQPLPTKLQRNYSQLQPSIC